MINLRKILIYSAIIIPAALIVFSLAGILKKTGSIEERIIAEFTANNEQVEIIKQNLIKMSSDLNQTRNLVGLPETEYSFESISDNTVEKESKAPVNNTLYFLGFEYLKNHFNEVELYRSMSEIAGNETFKSAAEKNRLTIVDEGNRYIINDIVSGKTLFSLRADKSENTLIIDSDFSSIEKKVLSLLNADTAAEYLDKNSNTARQINKKLSENISSLKNITTDSFVRTGLIKNKLYFDNYKSETEKTSLDVKRESGITVASIVLDHSDLTFSFCSNIYTDFNNLRNDIININNICDIRTSDEKRIEKSRNDLNILKEDSSFTEYLSDKGFSLSDTAREDNDYFYYDLISSSTGSKIGSFAVHKVSGEIYLTDHEEVPLSSLNMFSSSSKKKN